MTIKHNDFFQKNVTCLVPHKLYQNPEFFDIRKTPLPTDTNDILAQRLKKIRKISTL